MSARLLHRPVRGARVHLHGVVARAASAVLPGILMAGASALLPWVPAAALAAGDAAAGRVKSDDERCQECHGPTGQGHSADPTVPRLGGVDAGHIDRQLRDFRSGARKHAVMSIMAAGLSDEDIADIAAYFAAQPKGAAP